jgi:hypothetical protein
MAAADRQFADLVNLSVAKQAIASLIAHSQADYQRPQIFRIYPCRFCSPSSLPTGQITCLPAAVWRTHTVPAPTGDMPPALV